MSSFFRELKQRRVYRVAIGYAIAAWLAIQIAATVLPAFHAPEFVLPVLIILFGIGFPVALVLAWAFDVTTGGVEKTPEATGKLAARNTRHAWLLALAGVVIAGIAIGSYWMWHPWRSAPRTATGASPNDEGTSPLSTSTALAAIAAIPEKSIAVLPFENLSSDKENAFFAQGIQDEIITTLSKISGLKVISRTSTARYQSNPENLPAIGRELRVSNILEGSVQRRGERVHINVQLIQAETDGHVWAQSYDRDLTDIFSVEAELAKSIADSLSATLTPQEKARVESKPTNNADAYVLYLQGREYQNRPDTLLQDFKAAAAFYERAVALDSQFALARARLSAMHSTIYHWFEPVEARKRASRAEADEALRQQPALGEAHLALGLSSYYCESNYEEALREFDIAARALPNDAEVVFFAAAVRRRQGHWKEAIAAYQNAEKLDPRNRVMLYDAAQTFYTLRDWPAAAQGLDRVLALTPDSVVSKIQRAYIDFAWKGSSAPIKNALASIPPNIDPDGTVSFARWDVSMIDRNWNAAAQAVESCPLDAITSADGTALPKSYFMACIEIARGDSAAAGSGFESARPVLEAMVRESPQDPPRRAHLGLLYAFLGRREDALREARHAVELKPVSQDAVDGPAIEAFLALTYARLGMADDAIPLLKRILARPGGVDYASDGITLPDLRLRWEWDPLRQDPRFQEIVSPLASNETHN